jgi:RND family efflux transporter MFP subunit
MAEDTPQPARHGGRGKFVVAGGVAAALAAGIAIGRSGEDIHWSDEEDAAVEVRPDVTAPPAMPAPAATAVVSAPPQTVRGVVNARQQATIASRMTARIVEMPYREGQGFGAGAMLVRFDCSQLDAELKAANAAAAAYRTTFDTNVELDQFEAVGKNEVAVSRANLGKAVAEANAVAAQMADCVIRAPFAGKVVERIANVREVAASGQPLMKVQGGGSLEVELIAPSRWLTWLRPGAAFRFTIDETGAVVDGTLTRLGAAVDPVSKTIRVVGELEIGSALVLPGMSGSAVFARAGSEGENGEPS